MDRAFSQLIRTYSIVAFDPEAKQIGAAMQTHNFAECNGVIWVEPGVGAIARQADSDPFYAFAGFAMLASAKPPRKFCQASSSALTMRHTVRSPSLVSADTSRRIRAHAAFRKRGTKLGPTM